MNLLTVTETILETLQDVRSELAALRAERDLLRSIAEGVLTCLKYPRGSEAQVRCLEEVGQDASYALKAGTK